MYARSNNSIKILHTKKLYNLSGRYLDYSKLLTDKKFKLARFKLILELFLYMSEVFLCMDTDDAIFLQR